MVIAQNTEFERRERDRSGGATAQPQAKTNEEQIAEIEANEEFMTEDILLPKAPPEIQAYINRLGPANRQNFNSMIERFGYGSPQWNDFIQKAKVHPVEGYAESGTAEAPITLANYLRPIETAISEEVINAQEIRRNLTGILETLSRGELIQLSPETLEDVNSGIEDAYAPEYAQLETEFMKLSGQIEEGRVKGLGEVEAAKTQGLAETEEERVRSRAQIEEARTKARGLVDEQGLEALNQIAELRHSAQENFNVLRDEEKQNLLELSASTGRSPLDITYQRELASTLGERFTSLTERFALAERGALSEKQQRIRSIEDLVASQVRGTEELAGTRKLGVGAQARTLGMNIEDLTRTQQLGLGKETAAGKVQIEAAKAAARAAQKFSLQTGIPFQTLASGQAFQSLQNVVGTQNIANQLSQLGGIQSILAPLTAQRMGQPTTTTSEGFDPFGTVIGAATGAGSILGGIGALK